MAGTRYPRRIYLSLVPLTLGVMLACYNSHISFNSRIGLLAAVLSTFIFVLQTIYNKALLKTTELDKINLLFYSSICSFGFMIPIRMVSEVGFHSSSAAPLSPLIILGYFLNGLVHFLQNYTSFSVLVATSPVTYSIASLVKRIVVILFSLLWFGDEVEVVQCVGICLAVFGLWCYHSASSCSVVGDGVVRSGSVNEGHGS